MPSPRYDLRADDTIRFLCPIDARELHDGMRVGDAERCRLLSYVRLGRIAIVRNGQVIELKKTRSLEDTEPAAPRAIKRRPCLCCGTTMFSEGAHHRRCPRCRQQNEW